MTQLPSFDKLRWLAENRPDELENLQKTLCKEAIDSCPDKNKEQLISMQYHFEQQISRCSNPYHRCYLAMRLMNDKFLSLNSIINDSQEFQQNNAEILVWAPKLLGSEKL